MTLELKIDEADASITFTLKGELTYKAVSEVRHILSQLEGSEKAKNIIDFADVTYIDSFGLGMILAAKDRIPSSEVNQLTLRNPKGMVKNLFDLTDLSNLVAIEIG